MTMLLPETRQAAQAAARQAALRALLEDEIPFVVAGAYALRAYTGVARDTKDLDLCCRRQELDRALESLARSGFRIERTDPLWIAKGIAPDGEYVDVIFSSGNGLCEVDMLWMSRARRTFVFGLEVPVAAPEELIWSKSYVQERERYDGADIHHLLRVTLERLDWEFLLWRMAPHPEVLLAHLVLFGFAFPGDRDRVPAWVMDRLIARARRPLTPEERALCRGTLLSRGQYLRDVETGLRDARQEESESWAAHHPT